MYMFAEVQYFQQALGTNFSYKNSIWMCFITMSTVGYGEISPTSLHGKFVAMICAFLGITLQAATVIAMMNILDMSSAENFSYTLMTIVRIKEKVLLKATKILQTKFRLNRAKVEDKKKLIA